MFRSFGDSKSAAILLMWTMCLIGMVNKKLEAAAGCSPGSLLPGVKITGPCGAQPNEVCSAECTHKSRTVWQKRIRCFQGRWSPTPYCQGASIVQSLQMVDCEKLAVEVRGKTFCLKITQKITRKVQCPDLMDMKLTLRNCSREPHTNCKVSCGAGGGNVTLRCLPNGRWSHIPKCTVLKLKVCPVPKIGEVLNCSRREGEKCKVRCPDGKITDRSVVCTPSGTWATSDSTSRRVRKRSYTTPAPDDDEEKKKSANAILSGCSCPPPPVSEDMITTEDCSERKIGEKCRLGCRKHFALIGDSTVVCQDDLTWSRPFPECSDKTCPPPPLGESLQLAEEHCSVKLSGQTCELRCRGAAVMIQEEPLRCINGTQWTQLPRCVCNPPVLPEDMTTGEDCKEQKEVGSICELKCAGNTSALGLLHSITCQPDGSWTPVPRCQKNTCSEPDLPRATMAPKQGDCSSKRVGETCSLQCLRVPESYDIVCLNTTRWSDHPKCSCPSPTFSRNVRLEEDCSAKKPGEKCSVSCTDPQAASGNDLVVSCRGNSEWSSEPSCDKTVCPVPKLPSHLLFDEDCSHKGHGDACGLACRTGGKFADGGDGSVTCRGAESWSAFPACTCPNPNLGDDLEAAEDCSSKKADETCRVKCRGELSVPGDEFLTCRSDATWTDQPACSRKYCASPDLPSHLELSDRECAEKTVGDICEVACSGGREAVGPSTITCLASLEWSPFPSCTCEGPTLKDPDLQLPPEGCQNKQPGSECELKCGGGLRLLGSPFIRCLENSTWSTLPMCTSGACPHPGIPEHIVISGVCSNKDPGDECTVACKYGGRLLGDDVITCLSETHWSPAPLCTCPRPVFKNNLEAVTDCDAILPGKECYVQCGGKTQMSGQNFITCGNDSKWSEQPECNKVFCRRPALRFPLTVDDSCSSKVPGDECLVSCMEGGQIIGNPSIKCLNATAWSQVPDCGCPPPLFDEDLESVGDCSKKERGQKCNLRCKFGKKIIGKPYITCQDTSRWSSQPMCRIQLCAKPFLSGGILEPREDCTSKVPGEECRLRCIEGGQIIGPDAIKCLNATDWSKLPDCSCPEPDLPEHLELVGKCSNQPRGAQCTIACKGSKRLIGDSSITCSEKTKWSSFPICEVLFCPTPLLPKGVLMSLKDCSFKTANDKCELACEKSGKIIGESVITCLKGAEWSAYPDCTCGSPEMGDALTTVKGEDCSSKKRGEKCQLSCKDDKKISGDDYITCLNNTDWSSLPVCEEQFCPKPNLPPYLKAKGNCASKLKDKTCELSCSGGGTILGPSSITCFANLTWSRAPKCTCPPLDVAGDLKGNCSSVRPGMTCKVTCKSQFAIAERDSIQCNTEGKWSDLFSCKKAPCPNLEFSPSSIYVGKCENKLAGDFCYLRCKGSGRFVEDKNNIRCNKEGQWTKPRMCVCPPVESLVEFNLKESCVTKVPGDSCRIECKNGLDLKENGFISCDVSYKWTSAPSCQLNFCSAPLLTQGLIVTEGNCTQLKIRTSCQVECVRGGVLMGSGTIWCGADRSLSKVPACACHKPNLPDYLMAKDTCEWRQALDICFVHCKSQPAISHHLVCTMSEGVGMGWGPVIFCPCAFPTALNAYVNVDQKCLQLSSFPVNTSCPLFCGNSGGLVGGSEITCLAASVWSASPSCACIPPNVPTGAQFLDLSKCSLTLPGTSCPVKCTRGVATKNFMHCNGTYFWDKIPHCAINCPDINLELAKRGVGFNTECKTLKRFDAGLVCRVLCLRPGLFPKPQTIECTVNATWNTSMDEFQCSCHPPAPAESYKIAEQGDCRIKFKGEKCRYACSVPGMTIDPEFSSLICEGFNWGGELRCIPLGLWCSNPEQELRERKIVLLGDCRTKEKVPPGRNCKVACVSNTSLIAYPRTFFPPAKSMEMKCQPDGTFGEMKPQCTCPRLRLKHPYVMTENCDLKIHEDTCVIDAARGFGFSSGARDSARCMDGEWVDTPVIAPAPRCAAPPATADPLLVFPATCAGGQLNDRCALSCRNNAQFAMPQAGTTSFEVRCAEVARNSPPAWAPVPPPCACVPYPASQNLRLQDRCDQKLPGSTCLVLCVAENSWKYVTCTSAGTWTAIPCRP